MTQSFIAMCDTIGVPISEEKTEWESVRIIFLGILLDGNKLILTIPEEKWIRAIGMLNEMLSK